MPDGDFIRLNTLTDDECMTEITIDIVAGAGLKPTDRPEMIGDKLKYLQNEKVLEILKQHCICKPLSHDINDVKSQIWHGVMPDGDHIVAYFNRGDDWAERKATFAELGINAQQVEVHNLWWEYLNNKNESDGLKTESEFAFWIPPHGVKLMRLKLR